MAKKAISLILVALLIGVTTTFASTQKPLPKTIRGGTHAFINSIFTPANFAQALIDAGIQHPEIVYSQALIESGSFTSTIFRIGHNPFGMKKPEIRKTTAIGTYRKHAQFRNWLEAIADMKLWQDAKFKGKHVTQTEYLKALSKYAADKRYLAKVRKHIPISEELLRESS